MAERGYGEHDAERRLPEVHHSARTDFARDRARLLHSSAFRRLGQKTQVLSPTMGFDDSRTRLTHSLEVAQIGREIAGELGLDPDVVDTACLAHDIGHPPFGHNGERGLNEWALAIGGFEGNAQTLRVITRLEPKVLRERSYGLNLTRASLDAATKYPWPSAAAVEDPSGRMKFGCYADDREVFEWMREGAPEGRPSIEAQAMDLADDIAYSVHDFEDAVVGGYVDVAKLASRVGHDELVATMMAWLGPAYERDELLAAFDRLDDLETWIRSYDGSRGDQARLKNLTSKLIGRFAKAAVARTRASHEGPLVRFDGDIVVPREVRAEIAVLKGTAASFILSERRQPVYASQRRILQELCDALLRLGPEALDRAYADDWAAARDDAARARVVVDQVASLTDRGAFAWHERHVGD
ncbi:deoxyguanosinetriphosphate triphosphohydrolase [Agrococcus sp. SL85]|uniref:deoxyguanosinetriphosphate triphosphohydrolase n=1 Tax=Agrococcus sp. SL85 TaxID=2995141 RepID=UPI00226D26A6|nr:deoxyguanosinetriphosphate triphosphohydrolase [Agrococcus sp. SL85]WAC65726.1 deoxyguanosinetriphosphate triphosphohydrolase [Agrococcus sp. SL85]